METGVQLVEDARDNCDTAQKPELGRTDPSPPLAPNPKAALPSTNRARHQPTTMDKPKGLSTETS